MLTFSLKRANPSFKFLVFNLVYLSILTWFLPRFLSWDVNLYAGLILAPFIYQRKSDQFSLRYLVPTVIALVLTFFLPVKTLFFISLLFAILLFTENIVGKLNEAFLFLLFLISPVFKYLVATVDFPIRLWLTEKVSELLTVMGVHATAVGNQIEMEQYSFSVDPACAGLNMLIISLIICLFLTVQYQKSSNRQLNFWWIGAIFLITIGLNICSNFFRILLLVLFKIMPGTFFHDAMGMICLFIYVVLPLMLSLKLLIKHFGADIGKVNSPTKFNYEVRFPMLQAMILAGLIFTGSSIVKADALVPVNKNIRLSGFKKTFLETGISKFENKEILIYVKPAPFYIPGHDPKLCWTGSGYEFKKIKKEKIAGYEIYTAILTKNTDRIYAAWWFDSGKIKTIDQLFWRWEGATGKNPFYLINVNSISRKELITQVVQLLNNQQYLAH